MYKSASLFLFALQVFCQDLNEDRHREKSVGTESDLSFQYLERKLFHNDNEQSAYFQMPPNSSHVLPYCQALVSEYSKQSSNFIKCSIDNARPFRFCEGCVHHYKKTMTIFQDILENDETLDNCKYLLLNSDRVQVISSVHDDIIGIWRNADCDKCFSSITEDKNGTVHAVITAETKRFRILYENFTNCIPSSFNSTDRNDTVCDVCRPYYRAMNTMFDDLLHDGYSPHQVCMDIVDMMNYTRLAWGEQLYCTVTQKQRIPVILLSCFLLLIPLAFYSSVAVYGTKKEHTIMKQKRLTNTTSSSSMYGSYDNDHILGNDSSTSDSPDSVLGSSRQYTSTNNRSYVPLQS